LSRHTLEPRNPTHEVTIGWDPPLRTYFVQVFEPASDPDEDDRQIMWRGFGRLMGDELDLEQAIKLVQPYAAVPKHVYYQLVADELRDR
jgi:hypothetical protein